MVVMSCRKHNWEIEKSNWWSFGENYEQGTNKPFQGGKDDAIDELELILKGVLSEQQMADVPVGAFLSGGIDSSSVVSLLQSVSSAPVRTFTIGSTNQNYTVTLDCTTNCNKTITVNQY